MLPAVVWQFEGKAIAALELVAIPWCLPGKGLQRSAVGAPEMSSITVLLPGLFYIVDRKIALILGLREYIPAARHAALMARNCN